MPWYNLSPASYADGLEWRAARSEELAKRKDTEKEPWSPYDAAFYRRQARRLRAMAKLCRLSDAKRAGNVDFRRLSDPTLPQEEEDKVVIEVEAL